MTGLIAFQGRPGAYSDLACRNAYPDMQTLPCHTFDEAMAAVRDGKAELAMIAIENSLAGRVPDVHTLLPESGLFVIGEAFQRVEHCLLAIKGAKIENLKRAHSHAVALGQVRKVLKELSAKGLLTFTWASGREGRAEINLSKRWVSFHEVA